eukprot:jgi/Phyca11/132113/e_gw1.136.10.1
MKPPIKPNLTDKERQDVVLFLLLLSEHGNLDHSAQRQAADKFGVIPSTISRIWSRFLTYYKMEGIENVMSRRKGRAGRKKLDRECILQRIPAIPFRRRMTQRCIASELGVLLYVVRDALADGNILRHSNTIHPLLTKENKRARLRHAIRHVIHGTEGSYFSLVIVWG